MHGVGLATLVVGMQLTLKTQNILIVLLSVVIGGILWWWCISAGLDRASERLRERVARRLGSDMALFRRLYHRQSGFCVGPMTILGSIQDGLSGDFSLLSIKSVLDGFTAMALGSSLGLASSFPS